MTTQYADVLSGELRSLRIKTGYLQKQVSEMLGLSGPTMTRWENARDLPCLTRLVQVATEVFEVDPQTLLMQLERSAPDPRVDRLGIPVEQSVLRAGVTHYLATHKASSTRHASTSTARGVSNSSPRRTTPMRPRTDRNYATVLGTELFYIRTTKMGYDQNYVSDKTGIAQSNLTHIESGWCMPELVALVRLARFYRVCVQDLLIRVADRTAWDPTMPLTNCPQGLQILRGIPEDQPVLAALVAYDVGSRVPRSKPQGSNRSSSRTHD